MPNHRHLPRLNQRVAEEAQLLAEEKWIIEALKKIKAQRNGLQIERLHLESMREKINSSLNIEHTDEVTTAQTTNVETKMVEEPASVAQSNMFIADNMNVNHSPLDADDICNMEELNLSVTNSVFDRDPYAPCDEEEDEEDMENCLIDMEMLMSGK